MATGEKQPRGRPKSETLRAVRTEEILDSAAAIFAKHGYQDTEMQFIADALGIGKGTIYRYFSSKEDLFLKAVSRGMERLSQAVRTSGADASDPLDRITRAIFAYLSFFRSHPEYSELVVQERAQFKDTKTPTYFAHRENAAGRWRTVYQDLIDCGRVRNVPVERILDVINDLVYGTMITNYFSGVNKPLEAQARDLVDIIFYGILSDTERQRHPAESSAGESSAKGPTD